MWIELTTGADVKALVNTEHIITMEPMYSNVVGISGEKMQVGTVIMLPSAVIFKVKNLMSDIKGMMFDELSTEEV